ncbi:MAG: COG1361 S-layer family protein, partial [Anaerotignum sp.]
EPVDSSAVVPKSASMKTISALAPGASTRQSFTFAGTAASTSQNYAIQFTVEYTSGGTATTTFKQFAGVNVSNPDKDEDENKSKPKIIVSNYECNPLIVMAGEEFDLNLTLMNTHRDKAVKNIKMFLTLAEETSSETEKSGNIFTPVNSSNTFYFDSISPKGTVDKSLRLYVVPDAQPKTYTLTVNFEYEDGKGTEYTATELLGINVKQVTELQIDEFTVPEMVEQGMPVTVAFSYYNTGKVTLNNLMIKVEGDVDCPNRNTYIGNLESGNSDYFETTFTPNGVGEVPVSIIISYEDPSGETVEERRDLVLNVTEPFIPEDMEGMEENPPMDMKNIAAGIGLVILLAAALAVFVKKQKEPPKSTAESVSDVEDMEDEDDLDDDYVEEINEIIEEEHKEGMPL